MDMTKTQDFISQRRKKLADLRESSLDLFPNDFKVQHSIKDILNNKEAAKEVSQDSEPSWVVSGRIMAINQFGKAAFIRFRDYTGTLQAYIRRDKIGANAYTLFKKLDVGDFVGLTGTLFKTRTGEWTLLATTLKLVSKATRPLPEKFHGLRDPEKRYRQRYLDLIMNSKTRDIFVKRSGIIQAIRAFLLEQEFLEVETPMMQPLPGGAEATPFKTYHKALGMDLYLRIAPELYLKRLVVGGFEKVFEINRNFRNEGVSTRHNPEFTMLEFYQAYATYEDLVSLTQEMFCFVAREILGTLQFPYQSHLIDLETKWQTMTLMSSLTEIGGIETDRLTDQKALAECAKMHGITIDKAIRKGKLITKLFDILVEPKLIQPTFITGYPVEVSPLSRRNNIHPELTDRFELFIGGCEIANGFSELNDPVDQRTRFLQQMADREAGNDEAHPMDEDYIEALEYGMPPTAGEGIGIDRLVMLLTDSSSIREVILFPHMKHKR
jgi:lysyl-tRNA synthetase class 2